MAVNISARQLDDDDLAMHITTALFRSGLPACALQLEVTETAVITDLHMATQRLAELRRLGVAVAIDDFGTGQSSLTYLHRLHADVIKIDRSFVQALDVDRHAKAVAEGVIRLADSLGATTVAEGIENPAAAQTLKELGCSVGQGYLFGRPSDRDTTETMLRQGFLERSPALPAPQTDAAHTQRVARRPRRLFVDQRRESRWMAPRDAPDAAAPVEVR